MADLVFQNFIDPLTEREREREVFFDPLTERERDRERQTDRQTDRQAKDKKHDISGSTSHQDIPLKLKVWVSLDF